MNLVWHGTERDQKSRRRRAHSLLGLCAGPFRSPSSSLLQTLPRPPHLQPGNLAHSVASSRQGPFWPQASANNLDDLHNDKLIACLPAASSHGRSERADQRFVGETEFNQIKFGLAQSKYAPWGHRHTKHGIASRGLSCKITTLKWIKTRPGGKRAKMVA